MRFPRSRPGDRAIGRTAFDWRGLKREVQVLPDRLFLLQRCQTAIDVCPAGAARGLHATLARTGFAPIATLRCRRRVERLGTLEVWGPPT